MAAKRKITIFIEKIVQYKTEIEVEDDAEIQRFISANHPAAVGGWDEDERWRSRVYEGNDFQNITEQIQPNLRLDPKLLSEF